MRQRFANLGKLAIFDKLPDKSKLMLLDYEFNVGIKKFPIMRDAVLANDWETVEKEYKRFYRDPNTGKVEEVKLRNESTLDYFIKDNLP